jgi:hypothetical protein
VTVRDGDDTIRFVFADVEKYHGQGSIGGAAIGFKVVEAALGALFPDAPAPREALTIVSGHGGPGFRDAFELITRAVTRGAYTVDRDRQAGRLNPLSPTAYSFTFLVADGRAADVVMRDGIVPYRFYELWHLVGNGAAGAAERAELITVKRAVADDVIARPVAALFDVTVRRKRRAERVGGAR